MSLKIRQLSYAMGAEIIGVDIRKPMDDQTFEEVHAAFLKYCVLLFRGQEFTRQQFIAFSESFGELEDEDKILRHAVNVKDKEDIKILTAKFPVPVSESWHSDKNNKLVPTMATLLRAIEVPDVGGDTMLSNQYLAYETLSEGMKKLIDKLDGIYPGSKGRLDESTPERLAETMRVNAPVAQPLARVHPETGRKSLFLGERVKKIVGMTEEESKPLLDFLMQHSSRPQFVYRHVWQKNDLLMWDDRCTNHMAVGDYDRTQVRHTERTCVVGTPSGFIYDGPLTVKYA